THFSDHTALVCHGCSTPRPVRPAAALRKTRNQFRDKLTCVDTSLNAEHEAGPEAVARRRLEGVGSMPLFGADAVRSLEGACQSGPVLTGFLSSPFYSLPSTCNLRTMSSRRSFFLTFRTPFSGSMMVFRGASFQTWLALDAPCQGRSLCSLLFLLPHTCMHLG